jgi:hypothetical protein
VGGNGAAGGIRDGSPGTYTNNNSGGGGGAVGRIRINSRSGTATVSGVMSPAFSDLATTATQGAVTVQ